MDPRGAGFVELFTVPFLIDRCRLRRDAGMEAEKFGRGEGHGHDDRTERDAIVLHTDAGGGASIEFHRRHGIHLPRLRVDQRSGLAIEGDLHSGERQRCLPLWPRLVGYASFGTDSESSETDQLAGGDCVPRSEGGAVEHVRR
jgi:hypothetical protein